MHSFPPFFNLKISAKNRQHFFAIEKLNFRFFSFSKSSSNFAFFCDFLMDFFRISRQIPEKSDVCRFSINFCENKLENFWKFMKILKSVKIIQHYSILFNCVLSAGHRLLHDGSATEQGELRRFTSHRVCVFRSFLPQWLLKIVTSPDPNSLS